jgi:site-specific DNA-methyltransferase (adenine-specific)
MKPYYEDKRSGITIYHGDCREVLPRLPNVDLVITDPPYGINYRSGYRKTQREEIYGDNALPVDLISMSISKAEYCSYVFCRWDNLKEMASPKSVICWVKKNWTMGDLKHSHGRQWEAICFYDGPKHEFIKRTSDVIFGDIPVNRFHPTEKPESVIKQLILANRGEIILDTFMGSGTTLRAAKDLNRKAIGIEIEEKYCEVAAKRLSQEVFQLCV